MAGLGGGGGGERDWLIDGKSRLTKYKINVAQTSSLIGQFFLMKSQKLSDVTYLSLILTQIGPWRETGPRSQ